MEITAVIESINDGIVLLHAEDFGASFEVPDMLFKDDFAKGDEVVLKLDMNGSFVISH